MVPSVYDTMGEPLYSLPTDEDVGQDPLRRRLWLLRQALKSGSSIAEALKIAEEIEAFLVAGAASRSSNDTPNKVAAAPRGNACVEPSASQAAASALLNP